MPIPGIPPPIGILTLFIDICNSETKLDTRSHTTVTLHLLVHLLRHVAWVAGPGPARPVPRPRPPVPHVLLRVRPRPVAHHAAATAVTCAKYFY